MPVDISGTSYRIAELYHRSPTYFNTHIAARIVGSGGVSWAGATGQQSCAMRLSIALAWAGVHFPRVRNSWRLQGTNVYFPSLASDYPDLPLLSDAESITGSEAITGRKGVIYFGNLAGASGHVTLWDGSACHFGQSEAYWSGGNFHFWPMAN